MSMSRPLDVTILQSHDEQHDSSSSASSSRSSTPPLENRALNLQADNALPNDELLSRTTRQGKDWRAPSTIHERTFWQVRARSGLPSRRRLGLTVAHLQRTWGQKLMSSAVMDKSHHTLKDDSRGPVRSSIQRQLSLSRC